MANEEKKLPDNTQKTGKRGGKRSTSWKPGQSGNPNGAPKNTESWAKIIEQVGDMYIEDILPLVGETSPIGKLLVKHPPKVQLKVLVTARVFASLLTSPTSGLWNELISRKEGKLVEHIDHTTNGQSITLSDSERLERIAAIFDGARERRSGQATADGTEDVPDGSEETDTTS